MTNVASVPHLDQNFSSVETLSDAERDASLQNMLVGWNRTDPVWVFGYGSLIWHPEFSFDSQSCGVVYGFHRSLCLWSRLYRGTPEQPGLVLGLEPGGSCRGLAFRHPSRDCRAGADAPLGTRNDDGLLQSALARCAHHWQQRSQTAPGDRLHDGPQCGALRRRTGPRDLAWYLVPGARRALVPVPTTCCRPSSAWNSTASAIGI